MAAVCGGWGAGVFAPPLRGLLPSGKRAAQKGRLASGGGKAAKFRKRPGREKWPVLEVLECFGIRIWQRGFAPLYGPLLRSYGEIFGRWYLPKKLVFGMFELLTRKGFGCKINAGSANVSKFVSNIL
jgi:hypothetical protein